MAPPAAATLLRRVGASAAGRPRRGRGPGPLGWIVVALLALPLLLAAPFVAVQAGQPTGCGPSGASWDGLGSLGGFLGTGLTPAEVRELQAREGGRRLPAALRGRYTATVYAPAFGGINVWNGGLVTAGGIRVDAGARRAYLIAVDPTLIRLGTLVYVWPNPYGWPGPFIAADTGGAILDRHIDIYVFGDQAEATKTVNGWGKRTTRIAADPVAKGGPPTSSPADCEAGQLVGGNGDWTLTPYANRPGVGLTAAMRRFMDRLASFLPRPVVVCTGTNHSQFTTTGNVSDHWAGNAVDICSAANGFPATGGGYGDRIAAAAFRVAGYSPTAAATAARAGGTTTLTAAGLRIQIIWKSLVGGNHYDHVHVGIAPL